MAQSASDHAKTILSAIIPRRRDLLDKALRHLTPAHFSDVTYRNLFVMLERYAEVTQSIMTRDALSDMLSRTGADAGKVALYEETYDLLSDRESDDAAFRWSVDQIRELAAERATGDALTQSMEVLRSGATDDKGRELRGHVDARAHVLTAFSQIDRELSMQESPEGDVRQEADEILSSYADRKQARLMGESGGIQFGIPELDARIGGLQRGEMDLILGWTSSGKTGLCVQLAWRAAVMQGLNVVYATTETLRPQVRTRIISRHSRLDIFELPDGINTRDLKAGTLPDHIEAKFQDVVHDFHRNPSYGSLNVIQLPRGSGVGALESRLIRLDRTAPIDLVIMDYLQLFKPDRRRDSLREELSNIVQDAKGVAATFSDGRGVPIVSPWQVNRSSHEEAEKLQYYTLKALSETAESANTSDIVISLLEPAEKNRYVTLKGQILKNRDGETAGQMDIEVDYATSWYRSQSRMDSMDDLLG